MTLHPFFMRRALPEYHWIGWPGHEISPGPGWFWHQLKLQHRSGSLAVGSSHTVASGIATTNYHHLLLYCQDGFTFRFQLAVSFILLLEKIHGEMNTV